MSKTDKELTIDLVKSIIEANPSYSVGSSQRSAGLSMDEITNSLKHFYKVISNLDK